MGGAALCTMNRFASSTFTSRFAIGTLTYVALGGSAKASDTGTGATVIVADPEIPSAIAVIVAVPSTLASTIPSELTGTMPPLLDDQTNPLPGIESPFALNAVACN